MSNWNNYYKKSIEFKKPSVILKKFFELGLDNNKKNKKAIDFGCGSGNDTVFLLKNGYHVTAIDKENAVIDIIKNRVVDTSKLDFIIDSFENVKLSKADLIVSNMSLCFCSPIYFKKVCEEITNNIDIGGYFVGNFLGKDDGWSNNKTRSFIDEEELNSIFKDLELIYFKEQKFHKKTSKGNMKFWHVYHIIAKKK